MKKLHAPRRSIFSGIDTRLLWIALASYSGLRIGIWVRTTALFALFPAAFSLICVLVSVACPVFLLFIIPRWLSPIYAPKLFCFATCLCIFLFSFSFLTIHQWVGGGYSSIVSQAEHEYHRESRDEHKNERISGEKSGAKHINMSEERNTGEEEKKEILDNVFSIPAEVTGKIASREKEMPTPWGQSTCSMTVTITHASFLRAGSNEAIPPFPRKISVILPECGAIIGQYVHAHGSLTYDFSRLIFTFRAQKNSFTVSGKGYMLGRILRGLSEQTHSHLSQSSFASRSLIPGVAFGDESQFDSSLKNAMKTAGLQHLTAVSGGHISLMIGLVLLLIRGKYRRIRALCCIGGLSFLLILVGGEASVLRAVGMSIPLVIGIYFSRPAKALHSLSLTIICVSFLFPELACKVGFLLSSVACLSLILFSPRLATYLSRKLPSFLSQLVSVPITAWVATLPIVLMLGSPSSAFSPVANMLVAPVIAPLTGAGVLYCTVGQFLWGIGDMCLLICAGCSWWIAHIAYGCAALPFASLPAWALLLTGCVWLLLAYILIRFFRFTLCFLICVCLFLATCSFLQRPHSWEYLQCDVGQASAFLAKIEDKIIMIDVGENALSARCLKFAGVKNIDLLVLSHDHRDHIGGLKEVLKTTHVKEVWHPTVFADENHYRFLSSLFAKENIPLSCVRAGVRWHASSALHVLWPKMEDPPSQFSFNSATYGSREKKMYSSVQPNCEKEKTYSKNLNHYSLVLAIDAHVPAVILSDTGKEEQEAIKDDPHVRRLHNRGLLIIAHHGSSNQSEAFARSAHPRYAWISVGENTYGHPSPIVQQLYSTSAMQNTNENSHIWISDSRVSCARRFW